MSLRSIAGTAGLAALLLAPTVGGTTLASPASATASPSAPTAPRMPAIAPGHGSATVTWTAPASTGGSPITAYRVRVTPGQRTLTVAAPATSATVTGLADGTQVTATVVAINRVGTSPAAPAGSTIPTPPVSTLAESSDAGRFQDLAVAPDGTTYITTGDAILRVSADGATTTPLDVETTHAGAIAVAPDGDLYWVDRGPNGNPWVRRLHDGTVTTVAGNDDPAAEQLLPDHPVPATEGVLISPVDLAISPVDGSLFVSDHLCGAVLRFTVGGTIEIVAGRPASCGGVQVSDGDGLAKGAHLAYPIGLAVDDDGAVYVAESTAHKVRRFTVGGTISTVAGDGSQTIDLGDDLLATATGLPSASRITWAPGRGLLIDSLGRERLLVGDRLLRIGDDAFDRSLYESKAPADAAALVPSNDNTVALDWTGSTLHALVVVPDGADWKAKLQAVGPWLPASDPTEHPGFGSWADLVTLHHRAIVGRPPTTAERTAWVAALDARTTTPGQLDDALRRSAENTANVDPVVRLYRAFLGRAPDAGGLRFWIARKRNVAPARTWSVSQMAASFVASDEFQRKYGSLTDRAFVTRIYTDVLGRPADHGGVDFWTKRLAAKRMTRAQVMVGFSESSEYRRTQATNTDVAVAYLALVERMPTGEETMAWTTAAARGATHVELLDQLVEDAPGLL